jgi:hypothetical protein
MDPSELVPGSFMERLFGELFDFLFYFATVSRKQACAGFSSKYKNYL